MLNKMWLDWAAMGGSCSDELEWEAQLNRDCVLELERAAYLGNSIAFHIGGSVRPRSFATQRCESEGGGKL